MRAGYVVNKRSAGKHVYSFLCAGTEGRHAVDASTMTDEEILSVRL